MKCKCGCTAFYAEQSCRGCVTVIVNENGVFIENTTKFDEGCLDFDDPEPPFCCIKCNRIYGEEEIPEMGF
jgi:hypothetical protein